MGSSLLSIKNFQDEFGVSRSTVCRLRQRGEIEFVHIGRAVRIKREVADRWYASLSSEGANDA